MTPLLAVDTLNAWYGKSHVLQGVSFAMMPGETVALIGRNGAGKTTTMRAIMGLLGHVEGMVAFEGQPITGLASHVITRRGISLVPEHRGIFASLTVAENLRLAETRHSDWGVAETVEMFPSLKARWKTAGGKLSGGEQQMLSIARALMTGPKLLLLDEPTEGLAPVIVERLTELMGALKAKGLPILLVEQNLGVCRAVADRFVLIDQGEIVWTGDGDALERADDVFARHLTLEHA